MLHAMIMAGGGGTRFWPRSRQARPKQFLTLAGERTLLQATYDRVEMAVPPERAWVITGAAYQEETRRQLPQLPANHIVGEPCGRDTAACVGLGAALIHKSDPHAAMIVLPADHNIEPAQVFGKSLQVAGQLAEEFPNALITFGTKPTRAETGYGYIQRGELLGQRQGLTVHRVQKFREKPNAETARQYFASGAYYWNSGIFCGKAVVFLEQLRKHKPGIHEAVTRIADAWGLSQQDSVFAKEYSDIEKISIDYAVLERAPQVLVMEAPYNWDDVGSWLALERLQPQDAQHNTVQASHIGIDTSQCVIVGEPGKLIATLGISNLVIVQDGDCVLIADRSQEGKIRQLVEQLRKDGLEKYL
ncbi:MAG TPA: mannose-1-phosphate guanylyltransferase [Gemmataceae bacterium]|nr:mannose-1-phosphate guanylyltransferase [Gemmataceae bacterium]